LERSTDAAALFDRIVEELWDAGLQNVQVWDGRVSFEGTKWQWGKSKSRLGSVDVGEIELSMRDGKLAVSYRLRLRGLLLLTVACAVVGFYFFNWGDTHNSMVTSLVIAGSWLFSIIGNYVQAASDFKALIGRAIRGD
jgi:hypothetical protein